MNRAILPTWIAAPSLTLALVIVSGPFTVTSARAEVFSLRCEDAFHDVEVITVDTLENSVAEELIPSDVHNPNHCVYISKTVDGVTGPIERPNVCRPDPPSHKQYVRITDDAITWGNELGLTSLDRVTGGFRGSADTDGMCKPDSTTLD